MKDSWVHLAFGLLTGLPAIAAAQPPGSPNDGDRENAAAPSNASTAAPIAAPTDDAPSPWGDSPEAALRRLLGQSPPVASASPDPQLAAGTIRVEVVDEHLRPAPQAAVDIGVLRQGGGHQRQHRRSGNDGVAWFAGLSTGSGQAYRVNVHHQGAKYSSNPFQLPADQGYRVQIVRLPTTRSADVMLQAMGQTQVEFRDDRVHVVQSAQLVNLSGRSYLFPEAGQVIRMPRGFLALQADKTMGDQRLQTRRDGFLLRGSLPPGTSQLRWAFDLPLQGSAFDFEQPVVWRTHFYQVVVSAGDGMRLRVDGLPAAVPQRSQDGAFLVTQIERQPTSPPFDTLRLHIDGIPGPGPWRWIAAGLALALLFTLLLWPRRRAESAQLDAVAAQTRQQQLLQQARDLAIQHQHQEIGDAYYQRRLSELSTELAAALKQAQRAA